MAIFIPNQGREERGRKEREFGSVRESFRKEEV
jgi:hypothetical protein